MRHVFCAVLVYSLVLLSASVLNFALAPGARAQLSEKERTSPAPSTPAAAENSKAGAQTQPGTARPKIGVALEGGGALGLAHIGVLQWFEDHHIPIDYLAGTSMGGLVGGLYAMGKNPQELQELVDQQKWDIIIGGQ